MVTTIDVSFDIIHPSPSDLEVDLTDQGYPYIQYSLWYHQGEGQTDIHQTETGITWFQGEPVNQFWMIWVWDTYDTDSGYIDYWKITIWYDIKVEGHLSYFNLDDTSYHDLRQVSVQLYDWVTDSALSNIQPTGWNGNYAIDFDYNGHQVYLKVIFNNMFIDMATIYDADDDTIRPLSVTTIDMQDGVLAPCGGIINVQFSEVDINLKAAHIWDYILMERGFVSAYYSGWTRDVIDCFLDNDETNVKSHYYFNEGEDEEWIRLTNAQWGWRDETVLHEYAHAVHNHAHEWNVDWGEEHPNHDIDSVTNQYFAFCEGWAEFMSAIVPDDTPGRVWSDRGGIYKNIEDNDWWRGADTTNMDGCVVEGAVASALYDIQDDHYDSLDEYDNFHGWSASLSDLFPDIFRVFSKYRPPTIERFAEDWKSDDFSGHDPDSVYYLKNFMVAILRNHRIWVPFHADENFVPAPRSFSLSQNYPNPFNSQTVINYYIPTEGMVNLAIYNILGQKVKTCVNQKMITKYCNYLWDGKDDNGTEVASGVYIYRISYDNKQVSKLMLLLK